LIETDSDTIGVTSALKFKVSSIEGDTYEKGGIFFERSETSGRGDFIFALDNNTDTTNVAPADEIMRVTHEGNVGIGTTVPEQKLHVDGKVRLDSVMGGQGSIDLYTVVTDTATMCSTKCLAEIANAMCLGAWNNAGQDVGCISEGIGNRCLCAGIGD
jgi:hypothetical protein